MITEDQNKRVAINGIHINYTDSGGDKAPLIFIHGFPFDKSSWENQRETLARHKRVITYDIRGFGGSEPGNEQYSIDLFATDLVHFIDALKLGNVTACGLSMGGYILMNAVCRFPEKFSAMVLCDTQCISDSEEGREKRFKTILNIENDGLAKFADGFVQNVFCKETLENKKEVVKSLHQIIVSQDPATVKNTLKALAERKETCTQLKNITIPTLIVCGREDTVTPLSQSELLNNTISGSQLEIIEQAGHLTNMEQPERFNEIVRSFVEG